jgi:peptide/nickel transport system permease protein
MTSRPDDRPRVPWFVAFLARRMVWALITIIIFVAALFVVLEVWVPYSWATVQSGGNLTLEAELREAVGLNRPLPIRYGEFLLGLARGDLGTSFGGSPVTGLIRDAMPVTLTVFLVGTVLGWVSGELLGRIGSWNRSVVSGSALSTLGIASAAIFPPFLVFVLVFTMREPLLASRDAIGLPQDSLELWRGVLAGEEGALMPGDVWWVVALSLSAAVVAALIARAVARRHGLRLIEVAALPAALTGAGLGIWLSGLGPHALDLMYRVDITVTTGRGSPIMALLGVALLTFGQVMLLMGAGMDAQRDEDYVLTGRAKGLADHVVRDRHVARNAIPPVLAGSFLTFPTVLAGMMIIEFELEIAGLSSVLFDAIESQDIPVIMGILVVLGLVGVAFRLVTDVAIATLDPRRRGARA